MTEGSLGNRAGNKIVNANRIGKKTRVVTLDSNSVAAGYTTTFEEGYAYVDSAGNWRLAFNITGSVTGSTPVSITIAGCSFVNNIRVSCEVYSSGWVAARGTALSSGNVIYLDYSSSFTEFHISGNIPLASQPTDAFVTDDAATTFAEVLEDGSVDVYIQPADDTNAGTLSYYKEGTWTPGQGTISGSGWTSSGTYTRIGRQVFITGTVTGTGISATAAQYMADLPFTPSISGATGALTNAGNAISNNLYVSSSNTRLYVNEGFASTTGLTFSATYIV